jgi:hypothetical protein
MSRGSLEVGSGASGRAYALRSKLLAGGGRVGRLVYVDGERRKKLNVGCGAKHLSKQDGASRSLRTALRKHRRDDGNNKRKRNHKSHRSRRGEDPQVRGTGSRMDGK